jgi:hypothetical protein
MSLNDSTPLAAPTFVTGPLDNVAAADPYKAKGGVINSIQDTLKKAGISIPDVLKGGKALATLLPIVQGLKNGSLLVDRNSLITRLLASSTAITSAFKFLGTDAQNSILGNLKDVGKYAVTINGMVRQVQTTNFNDLSGIGRLVNSFTGDATSFLAVDKDSLAGIVAGTVKECTRFGIPNSFSAITATINDSTIIKSAIGQSLTDVIGASDVASLKAMCTAVGDGSIPLINPNTIGMFGTQFNRSVATVLNAAPTNDAGTLASIMDTYNAVDSKWNSCTRSTASGDQPTFSIASLTGASSDFKDMLSNGVKTMTDDNAHLYALASVYGSTDVNTTLSNDFPTTVLTTPTASSQQTTAKPLGEAIIDKLASFMPGLGATYNPATGKQWTDADTVAFNQANNQNNALRGDGTVPAASSAPVAIPAAATQVSQVLNAIPPATTATAGSSKMVNSAFPGMTQEETDQWFADHQQVVDQFNLNGKNTNGSQGYYSKGINF